MAGPEREKDAAPWLVKGPEGDYHCRNWSGSLRFRPARIEAPESEAELQQLVRTLAGQGRTLRPIGSAHSSSAVVATDDVLVSLRHFSGLRSYDRQTCRARVGAGMLLSDLGEALAEVGLAMPNYGDVATQTLAGALGTGTHGSGQRLYNLSMTLVGGRLVTGTGDIVAFSVERDPDLVRALRVSMGLLGVLTEVELQLEPGYDLHRQEWCSDFSACFDRIDTLAGENRNFDLYWYPRSDEVKLRCLNPPGAAPDYSGFARLVEDKTGPSHEIIPKHSDIPDRFDEMEYALPAEAGPECLLAVRARLREKWRRIVAWRVLYRFIRADDSWLSEAHGRETVSISLHQNSALPFRAFFADIEPIFQAHGGRPHWAKIHAMGGDALRARYPMAERFFALRRALDPDGVFLTPALRAMFAIGDGA